jgi:hypothetical protein
VDRFFIARIIRRDLYIRSPLRMTDFVVNNRKRKLDDESKEETSPINQKKIKEANEQTLAVKFTHFDFNKPFKSTINRPLPPRFIFPVNQIQPKIFIVKTNGQQMQMNNASGQISNNYQSSFEMNLVNAQMVEMRPIVVHLNREDAEYVDDSMKLELHKYMTRNCKNLYTHVQRDSNNNLLVFPKDADCADKLMVSKTFFPNAVRKVNLIKSSQTGHYVLILNMSYDLSQSSDYASDLKRCGIVEVLPPPQDAEQSRNVKCRVSCPSTKLKLIEAKKIIIGSHQFAIEPSIVLLQCRNCKEFGHVNTMEKRCKNPYCCFRCRNRYHDEEYCNSNSSEWRCVNCNGHHHSYSKKCPKFIEMKNRLISFTFKPLSFL